MGQRQREPAVQSVVLSEQAPALAQAYPARPVTVIVPWGAGGGTDATARIWALDRPDKPIVLPHGQALLSATWSPDGAQVVTMTIERRGKVWPATIPALQRALERATKDCLLPTMRGTYLDEEAHEARATAGCPLCAALAGAREPAVV